MADEGKSTLSAGKRGAMEFVDLLVTYLLPLGAFFVGAFSGVKTWGGVNALYGITSKNQAISTKNGLLSMVLYGGIFGATGYGFWHLGHTDGLPSKVVGRGFAGYFWGVAVSYVMYGLSSQAATGDGLIDELVHAIQGL